MIHRLAVERAEREIERLRARAATAEERARALAGDMFGRLRATSRRRAPSLGSCRRCWPRRSPWRLGCWPIARRRLRSPTRRRNSGGLRSERQEPSGRSPGPR